MAKTQDIWILCGALLTLNSLNAIEQTKNIAAKRHWITETTKVNQTIYIENVLPSGWMSENSVGG